MKIHTVTLAVLALLFVIVAETVLAPRVTVTLAESNTPTCMSFPMTLYLGDSFSTSYIHSVQLCTVTDVYCVSSGRLWLLEERTGSTGAGLPSEASPRGQFVHDRKHGVYRYIGGTRSDCGTEIFLRVGTDKIGRNTLTPPLGISWEFGKSQQQPESFNSTLCSNNSEIVLELWQLCPDELLKLAI